MSTFFIFVGNLLSLNFGWIINFLLHNLFWIFALAMLCSILFGEKALQGFFVMTPALWLWGDFEALSGVGFYGAKVLVLYYVSKIGILTIVENTPSLKKHILIVSTISGAIALLLANVFT